MRKDLTFSIITVCYNAEKTIRNTIESVLRQTIENFEYIIVDGASTDSTIRIVKEYSQKDTRICWYSEPDNGIYHAMNKGIRYAQGQYIYFLNAGDEFHNSHVLEDVSYVIMDLEADIIVGNIGFKTGFEIKEKKYEVGKTLLELLQSGDSICHQAVFASASCLEEGFDEHFRICADYNWLCQMVNQGKTIVKAELMIADYDVHGISNQACYQKLHWNESFEVVRKNFPELNTKELSRIQSLFIQQKKSRFLYETMNQWLILKQRQVDISSFFVQQGFFKIAIYGMHYIGQRLYDELRGSSVKVEYVIDKRNISNIDGLRMYDPKSNLVMVDAVVITPVFDFIEIRERLLQKLCCPMFSVEEILFSSQFYTNKNR